MKNLKEEKIFKRTEKKKKKTEILVGNLQAKLL